MGGIWNLKVKELFLIVCLFLIACFKTIILKTYFEENKVKALVYEVPAFVTWLTEPLSFCVSDHDGKIKENSHALNIYFKNIKK